MCLHPPVYLHLLFCLLQLKLNCTTITLMTISCEKGNNRMNFSQQGKITDTKLVFWFLLKAIFLQIHFTFFTICQPVDLPVNNTASTPHWILIRGRTFFSLYAFERMNLATSLQYKHHAEDSDLTHWLSTNQCMHVTAINLLFNLHLVCINT